MDHAGFLVMHEDFMLSSATAADLEHVHITEKETHIAEDLINKGFLIKKECRNLEEIKKQSFYEVNSTMSGVQELKSTDCKYELGRITGTNVFLGQHRFSFYINNSIAVHLVVWLLITHRLISTRRGINDDSL